MTTLLYANNAAGTLAQAITASQTTFTLNAGQAALFPTPGAGQAFYCTLVSVTIPTQIEIVLVTSNSASVFTVTRGQDGTTPAAFNAGDIVSQRAVAFELRLFQAASQGLFDAAGLAVAISPDTTLGVVGTTLADNAVAGSVGEYLSNTGSVSLVSTTTANIVTLSLTAGDWDVSGTNWFISNVSGAASQLTLSVSTTSLYSPSANLGDTTKLTAAFTTQGQEFISTPVLRVNVATTTTLYLVANATFTGTMSASGFLRARRIR